MLDKAKFITIHGIDGTGKTTLVGEIESALKKNGLNVSPIDTGQLLNPWQLHRDAF